MQIRQVKRSDPDFESALYFVLDAEPHEDGAMADQVADVLRSIETGSISVELFQGAYEGSTLVSACLAAQSPGGAALVFLPARNSSELSQEAAYLCLDAVCQLAWKDQIDLLEALTPFNRGFVADVLNRAGFRQLTTLVYYSRGVSSIPNLESPEDIGWLPFSVSNEPVFCAALEASYAQSLDCPELMGLRATENVLAGHRASGEFDPNLWWVAMRGGRPVGIILLNRLIDQPAMEIVYIGVAQGSRGTGVANALLNRALHDSRSVGAKVVTLAVDCRNAPALRMYDRWGFQATLERFAWIATR